MEKQIALLLALLLCSPFLAFAVPGSAKPFSATSTLFTCTKKSGGSANHMEAIYSAKANDALWANGTACGKYYCVLCTGGADSSQPSPCRKEAYTIVVIQENCPNCEATMNISRDGFAAIADPNIANTIKMDYAEIENLDFPCA